MRPAKCSEASLLSELAVRSKAYWGYSADFMKACRKELAVSEDDIRDSFREYVVCEIDGAVVGYFAIESICQGSCELEALFVEPAHIGRGYGRALIEAAKSLAAYRGARTLIIQGDPNAEKFYTAAGGVRVGHRESGSIPGRFPPEFRVNLALDDSATADVHRSFGSDKV